MGAVRGRIHSRGAPMSTKPEPPAPAATLRSAVEPGTIRSVALFGSSFHPHLGGVEELVRQLAHRQLAVGGRPLVVTMRWPKSLPARDTFEGIPVRRHVFRLPERDPRWLAAYALEHRAIQHSVERELTAHGCDLVHVQCVSNNGWYARRAAQSLGLPLVVSLQGELTMDASNVYNTSTVLPHLLRRLLREADAVTACSRHTLAEAEAFSSVALGDRGHVIPNGVNLEEIRSATPPSRKPYVLAIGRHVDEKGFDVLLRAWRRVRDTVAECPDLVIAGDGPARADLEQLARSLGIGEHVDFPGRCDRPATAALFAGCESFVLPSRHEPFGIVNAEAMAAGRPIVATRVGGVPEIVIDGDNGLLVPPEDPDALSAALRRVLTEPDLAARLATRARESAPRYDWANIADAYDALYSAIVERRAAEPAGSRRG